MSENEKLVEEIETEHSAWKAAPSGSSVGLAAHSRFLHRLEMYWPQISAALLFPRSGWGEALEEIGGIPKYQHICAELLNFAESIPASHPHYETHKEAVNLIRALAGALPPEVQKP